MSPQHQQMIEAIIPAGLSAGTHDALAEGQTALEFVDLVLEHFVTLCLPSLELNALPEWQDRPLAISPADRPLWANRRAVMAGATGLLEIGIGSGMGAALALGLLPELRYFGIDSTDLPLARAVTNRLISIYPDRAQARFGDLERVLASMRPNPAGRFDRVRINRADSFLACRAYLLEALGLCTQDGLILVEHCDQPHVNEAVITVLANGTVQCAFLPGWQHVPEQILLRRPVAAAPHHPREERSRIILVAACGDAVRCEWAISRPSVAAYAQRVGATLVTFTADLPAPQRPLAKLVALDRLAQRGRVLLLDADIIIRDDAPDLFELVPADAAALFLEGQMVDRAEYLRDTLSWHGCTARKPFYANSGVFMLPEHLVQHFALSAVHTTVHLAPMHEQGYFNALLHQLGFPVFNLSPLFNCMPAVTPEKCEQAFFVHFAGGSAGVRHTKIWEESNDPVSSVTFRTQRNLSGKELRVFDMRNEMHLAAGKVDRLVPASHLLVRRGILLCIRGCFVLRCPASRELLVWGPYIDLPPGAYRMDVLLSEIAFRRAYLDGIDSAAAMLFPGEAAADAAPAHLAFGVTQRNATEVLVPSAEVEVEDGCAQVAFALLDTAEQVECHITGGDQCFDLYGLRFRAAAPLGSPG